MGSGPCWYTYEKGFSNCSEYWWSVFTMTINFIPGHVIANEGCYYWGWFPACDIQIFVFLPWLIYATFKIKSNLGKALFLSTGVIAGIVLNFYIIWSGDFAAAMFNPKDILIF
jgi:hypothetical protein